MCKMEVGPYFDPPPLPALSDGDTLVVPDTNKVKRSFRQRYDWTAYTPQGLAKMERYWDEFVRCNLMRLLPLDLQRDPQRFRGINLGTFNGAYQKAWVRAGYGMYGIEIVDVVDELREYGLSGHCASFYNLSSIGEGEFDFGVLDRALCTRGDYGSIDRSYEPDPTPIYPSATVEKLFASIFRVIKPGGTLIGILYGYYSGRITRELAKYGSVKIWPTYGGLLGFRVVKNGEVTEMPSVMSEPISESRFYRRFCRGKEGLVGLFLPTNEVVVEDTPPRVMFAPHHPQFEMLSR